jgi:hypothetical protein
VRRSYGDCSSRKRRDYDEDGEDDGESGSNRNARRARDDRDCIYYGENAHHDVNCKYPGCYKELNHFRGQCTKLHLSKKEIWHKSLIKLFRWERPLVVARKAVAKIFEDGLVQWRSLGDLEVEAEASDAMATVRRLSAKAGIQPPPVPSVASASASFVAHSEYFERTASGMRREMHRMSASLDAVNQTTDKLLTLIDWPCLHKLLWTTVDKLDEHSQTSSSRVTSESHAHASPPGERGNVSYRECNG